MYLLRNSVVILLYVCGLLVVSCAPKSASKSNGFAMHKNGFRYRLLSFTESGKEPNRGGILKICLTFKNQKDSVFWDNVNNLGEDFVIDLTKGTKNDNLSAVLSAFAAGDSACVLMDADDFFLQQFKSTKKPWFSKSDSVVIVNFRIKELVDQASYKVQQPDRFKEEELRIRALYSSNQDFESAKDPKGFYWLKRSSESNSDNIPQFNDRIIISYQGCFLNGRILDQSTGDFEMIYGTPDQILPGLNYVIGSLKVGENAKIVLPSRLAFGEKGSSDGTVPPYTPLVYTLTLKEIKKTK